MHIIIIATFMTLHSTNIFSISRVIDRIIITTSPTDVRTLVGMVLGSVDDGL